MNATCAGVGKERTGADEIVAGGVSGHGSQSHRNEAPRLPFEQQQFNREQCGRDRRGEGRRHASGGARYEKRLALGAGKPKKLRNQRTKRAARHDDRPFGAKRAT